MIPAHEILDEEHETMDVPPCLVCVGELLLMHHSDEASCWWWASTLDLIGRSLYHLVRQQVNKWVLVSSRVISSANVLQCWSVPELWAVHMLCFLTKLLDLHTLLEPLLILSWSPLSTKYQWLKYRRGVIHNPWRQTLNVQRIAYWDCTHGVIAVSTACVVGGHLCFITLYQPQCNSRYWRGWGAALAGRRRF